MNLDWCLQILHKSVRDFPSVEEFPQEINQELLAQGFLIVHTNRCHLSLSALQKMTAAKDERGAIDETLFFIQQFYQNKRTQRTTVTEIAERMKRPQEEVARSLTYLSELPIFIKPEPDLRTGFLSSFALSSVVLSVSLWSSVALPAPPPAWHTKSFSVDGYKPFLRAQSAISHPQTNIHGPSGSGKTCLLAALQFLRYATGNALPQEIDPWWQGARLFTTGCPEAIRLGVELSVAGEALRYEVEIHGEGPPKIFREICTLTHEGEVVHLLSVIAGRGVFFSDQEKASRALPFLTKPNETWMLHVDTLEQPWLSALRRFLLFSESFFSQDAIDRARETILVERLREMPKERIDWIQQFLREHLDGFAGFSLTNERIVWRETALREEIFWSEASESARRIFWLAALSQSGAPLIALDTPHRGVSPELHAAIDILLEQMASSSQLIVSLDTPPLTPSAVRLNKTTGRPLAKNV